MGFFDETVDEAWLKPAPGMAHDPPWLGPPYDVIAAAVGEHVDLVRTPDLAMWLAPLWVYPIGILLALEVRWAATRRLRLPIVPGDSGRDGFCVGVQFDDGRRVLAVPRRRRRAESQPPAVSLVATPTRARHCLATIELWLWPLPTASLAVVIEWRTQRVREAHAHISADPLAGVAAAARPVWPAAAPPTA